MKIYESSVLRPCGSLFRGVLVMSLLVAACLGFVAVVLYSGSGAWRPDLLQEAARQPLFLLPSALVLLFGVPMTWSAFTRSRGSYRAGPTDLEIRSGWPGQKLRVVPYADITRIDSSRGPLMRLLGTSDLSIAMKSAPFLATLHGVRNGEEIRRSLLERRDSLRELLVEGEGPPGTMSNDVVLERLARVLERLEKRLP